MKVLMINGSPHERGCTYTALTVIAEELRSQGVESEIVWLGTGAVHSCRGCNGCKTLGRCVIEGDMVNEIAEKVKNADGYVFASPVHYASPAGSMVAFMDRLFWSAGKYMSFKPACCVVSARRAGTTASYDVLNKYLGINSMIEVPSTYWNMVHGASAEEVLKDKEGVSIMRALGSNMAWLLKVLKAQEGTDLERPKIVEKERTNFIREDL